MWAASSESAWVNILARTVNARTTHAKYLVAQPPPPKDQAHLPRRLVEGAAAHLREAGIESRDTPMKSHLPNSHDEQSEWTRVRIEHDLNAERLDGRRRRPSWQRRALIGLILGSFFFLIVSCFYVMRLDESKIDRGQLNFQHRP